MNIKPFRNYDEAEVVNGFFSLQESSGDKGSLVELVSFNPSDNLGYANSLTSVSGVFSRRMEVKGKVKLAASGVTDGKLLGILLYDVRETDEHGRPLIYEPEYKRVERQVVVSGDAVPILTRGVLEVNGMVGTPGPGSGAQVSDLGSGGIKVVGPAVTPVIGKFISSTGADGYALLKVQL